MSDVSNGLWNATSALSLAAVPVPVWMLAATLRVMGDDDAAKRAMARFVSITQGNPAEDARRTEVEEALRAPAAVPAEADAGTLSPPQMRPDGKGRPDGPGQVLDPSSEPPKGP